MRVEHFKRQRPGWFKVGRRLWWLAALAFVLVVACVVDWSMSQRRHAAARMQSAFSSNTSANASSISLHDSQGVFPVAVHAVRSRKVVFPYSVIPGGIRSIEELKNAIASDPVVSAEYSGFHLANARIIRLDRQRTMHVSYRLGDRVYWTKGELVLAKGETLITDGTETARTKCGNMVAEAMVAPVSPNEPTAQQFNTPVASPYEPVGEVEGESQSPEIAQAAYSDIPTSHSSVPPVGGNPFSGGANEPAIFLPSDPGVPAPSPTVATTPPVVKTPEPGTAILLLVALLALFFLHRRKRKDAPKIVA